MNRSKSLLSLIAVSSLLISFTTPPAYALRANATKHSPEYLKDLQSALRKAALGRLSAAGFQAARAEVRSTGVVQDWRGIPSAALRQVVQAQETEIAGMLERPGTDFANLGLFFLNVNWQNQDQTGQLVSGFLSDKNTLQGIVRAALPPEEGARKDVSIPVLSESSAPKLREFRRTLPGEPEDFNRILSGSDILRLPRVPLRGVLFFAETGKSDIAFNLGSNSYRIPGEVLFWTFEDGILAVNVTVLKEETYESRVVTVGAALAAAMARPEVEGSDTGRSELRRVVETLVDSRASAQEGLRLPVIPEPQRAQSVVAIAEFGVHPNEGLILDAEFIKTSHGLALALTVFRQIPLVILGLDETDPFASSLNQKLVSVKYEPFTFTSDPVEAVSLLRGKIKEREARLGRETTEEYALQAILSRPGPAEEALKSRLGLGRDLVRVMGFEEFFSIASGIVSRLGLDQLVRDLQTQVLNQFFVSRSA